MRSVCCRNALRHNLICDKIRMDEVEIRREESIPLLWSC